MWISILVVALVVAMAVGPIMWFRSTPAQRRTVAMRQRASSLGLRVRLISGKDLELPGRADEVAIAGYGLSWGFGPDGGFAGPAARRAWRLVRERISHASHFSDEWNWQRGRVADPALQPKLRDLLSHLPADALALEGNRDGFWLYWQERGSVEQVDRLAGLLRELRDYAVRLEPPGAEVE